MLGYATLLHSTKKWEDATSTVCSQVSRQHLILRMASVKPDEANLSPHAATQPLTHLQTSTVCAAFGGGVTTLSSPPSMCNRPLKFTVKEPSDRLGRWQEAITAAIRSGRVGKLLKSLVRIDGHTAEHKTALLNGVTYSNSRAAACSLKYAFVLQPGKLSCSCFHIYKAFAISHKYIICYWMNERFKTCMLA